MEVLSASPIYDDCDDVCDNLILHASGRKFFQDLLDQALGKSRL